ncbi:MAG TPA: dihydrofolate reductase family protein [Candidatus Limnocylindria bacterium]|jgi:dihydrofolate reductase
MRKVVVFELLSLEGVAEAPETFFGWDDALDAKLGAVISTQDTVILGRRTYAEWAKFWPSSDVEPFATFINRVPKLIVTSSPLDASWDNTTEIRDDLVSFVRDLRRQPRGDIGIHGSISVARALLAADLVDELKLIFGPMIVGSGRRLLDDLPPMRLESIGSEVSPSGYLVAEYRVKR